MRTLAPSLLFLIGSACTTEVCVYGEYGAAECRVAAQHHYAQLLTSSGVDVRFQEPGADDASSWAALGRVQETASGHVNVRPATLTDFAVSLDPGVLGASELHLTLENVAPDAVLTLGPDGDLVSLGPSNAGTRRELTVALDDEVVWLRGERACPERYRLAMAGDVQTNPLQFERILTALHEELADAEAAGEPLLGFVFLGDLAEVPTEDELAHVVELLARSPVPVSTIPGNHDVNGDELALYNRLLGPGTYGQAVCSTWLPLLDTGTGDLAPSVQASLPELLDRGDLPHLIVGGHYPAWAGRTGNGWGDEDSAWYLLSELSRNEADLYVAGHYHAWEEMPSIAVGDGEVHQVISGTAGADQGSGVPRYGFTRVTVSPEGVDSCFREVLPPGRTEGGSGTQAGIRTCP